jgi:hypothetical protein
VSAAEIDEYLRGVDEPKRGTLQALRQRPFTPRADGPPVHSSLRV